LGFIGCGKDGLALPKTSLRVQERNWIVFGELVLLTSSAAAEGWLQIKLFGLGSGHPLVVTGSYQNHSGNAWGCIQH